MGNSVIFTTEAYLCVFIIRQMDSKNTEIGILESDRIIFTEWNDTNQWYLEAQANKGYGTKMKLRHTTTSGALVLFALAVANNLKLHRL